MIKEKKRNQIWLSTKLKNEKKKYEDTRKTLILRKLLNRHKYANMEKPF